MLEVISLSKNYGDVKALNKLSFKLKQGEIFCLLGQNGAGKTITINILLELLTQTTGKAYVNGICINKQSVSHSKIAYIPEVVQLYGNLSAIDNLVFFSRLAGYKYSKKELFIYLNQSSLQTEFFENRLDTYSKGMRQKVGIAIALTKKASFILMDVPTSGLDPKASVEFADICEKLAKKGVGILMATHDIFNAVNIGSRIGIMKEGALIYTTKT